MTKDEKINTYIFTTITTKVANQITRQSKANRTSTARSATALRKVVRELNNVELKIIHTDKLCENEK